MNTSGPFIHSRRTTRVLMLQVLVALSLIVGAATWRYGGTALLLVGGAVLGALIGDVAGDYRRAGDGSACVAGVIVALLLPAQSPWWLAVLGGVMAMVFGKHFLGGFGANLFNPAALSRVVLMGVAPMYFFAPRWTLDGVSRATPLAKEIGLQPTTLSALLWGEYPGTLAEALPACTLLAGLVLVMCRAIDWRVPLVYLGSVSFMALVLPVSERIAGHAPWLAGNPLPHLLAGGSLLTAFFLLTDPVTSPLSPGGRIVFASLAGVYTMLVRYYTIYPDSAAMAVLLANAVVPLIDRHLPGGRAA